MSTELYSGWQSTGTWAHPSQTPDLPHTRLLSRPTIVPKHRDRISPVASTVPGRVLHARRCLESDGPAAKLFGVEAQSSVPRYPNWLLLRSNTAQVPGHLESRNASARRAPPHTVNR